MNGIQKILASRICQPISVLGSPEHVLSVALAENLVFPPDERRKIEGINGLRIDAKTDTNARLSLKEPRALSEVVRELCQQHNLQIVREGGTLVITA